MLTLHLYASDLTAEPRMVNKKIRYEPSVREATGNVDVSSQSVDVSSRSKGMENRMEMGEVTATHSTCRHQPKAECFHESNPSPRKQQAHSTVAVYQRESVWKYRICSSRQFETHKPT